MYKRQQLTVPAGSLLGGVGTGIGVPQVITVGENLNFNGSTLSATASPFSIPALPTGTVPASGDLISISQAGTNVAVTYSQLLAGMSGVADVDLSHALVTPTLSLIHILALEGATHGNWSRV